MVLGRAQFVLQGNLAFGGSSGSTARPRFMPKPRAAAGVGAPAAGDSLGYVGQLTTKALATLTGLWGRKKLHRAYQEPHWVLLVNAALVVAWRAGLVRASARGLLRLMRLLQRQLRRPDPAEPDAELGESSKAAQDSQVSQAAPVSSLEEDDDTNIVSVRGDGEQTVDDAGETETVPGDLLISSLISAAEGPVIICCLVSIACHLAVLVLKLLGKSGHVSNVVAEGIWRVWVGQLLNYTLNTSWLLLRLLNVRLALSRSRPSLSGDLSDLAASAGTTSRRFAQESAVTHLAKTTIFVVAGLVSLRHLGVNVQRVLAVTSLSGVAISFLLGDILSNLFGGFVLYVTQPFAQGDWVQSTEGKVDGWIQNLGWYYTAVVRWDKRPLYIPNSNFGFTPIVNCSRMTHRRILIEGPLKIRDLDKVEQILGDARTLIENHNDVDKTMHRLCRLKKVEDFSVVIWLSCYIRKITLAEFLRVQESVLLGLCAILRKHNTNWACSTERFASTSGGEEVTAESRRILNARTALLRHQSDLEERQQQLEQRKAEVQTQTQELAARVAELEPAVSRLRQRKDLLQTRRKSVQKWQWAIQTKSGSLNMRKEALAKLRSSIELFNFQPAEALALGRDALETREKSVQRSWAAVVIERGAIESEKDALEQERELLEAAAAALTLPVELEEPKQLEGQGKLAQEGSAATAEEPEETQPADAVAVGGAVEVVPSSVPAGSSSKPSQSGTGALAHTVMSDAKPEEDNAGPTQEELELEAEMDVREERARSIGGE